MSSPEDVSDARQALLMVCTDVPAEIESRFNDWYNRERLRERIEVPGFIRARRFVMQPSSFRVLYTMHS
jgi:hypothetical protein